MRKDMTKVIAERPRAGSSVRLKVGVIARTQRTPIEELPGREPMSASWHNGWDDMTRTHRTPVERFLRKQVGRRWDEVYSEVCAVAPKGTKAGQRLREVVLNAVETSVFMDGEDIRCKWGYRVGGLFVHPQTGVLSLPETHRRRYRYQPKNNSGWETVHAPADGSGAACCFVKVDGIWYRVTLVPLPADEEAAKLMPFTERYDEILKDYVWGTERGLKYGNRFRQVWGSDVFARYKRQASKLEIRWIKSKLFGDKAEKGGRKERGADFRSRRPGRR